MSYYEQLSLGIQHTGYSLNPQCLESRPVRCIVVWVGFEPGTISRGVARGGFQGFWNFPFLSHLDPSLCQYLERPLCDTYHWPNSFWWFGLPPPTLKNAGYAPVIVLNLETLTSELRHLETQSGCEVISRASHLYDRGLISGIGTWAEIVNLNLTPRSFFRVLPLQIWLLRPARFDQ